MLVITDDSTPAELREAISHLRDRQRRAKDRDVRDEIDTDVNALLDRLATCT